MGNKTRYISLIAILSALATVMTLLRLEILYPPLPYLKFDFAEIPSVIALLICDLKASLLVALVHFMILMTKGEFVPIGPLMKFSAVLSTVLPLGIMLKSSKEVNLRSIMYGTIVGIVFRCTIMTILNYLVLVFLMPDLIKIASLLLRKAINAGYIDDLTCILLFTGLYNAIHVVLTVGLAYIIFKHIKVLIPSMQ